MSTTQTGTTHARATPSSEVGGRPPVFVTTHWSVVLSARRKDSPQSAAALETLCRTYWYPLYAYVRRQGHSPPDAQDLTQEFFARLLQKDYLKAAAQEKGRFRTFLIVALKRFLANEWDRARAQKRGGGQALLSLDTELAEQRYRIEPVEGSTAEKVFERRWALTLLDRTMTRLREEFGAAGKSRRVRPAEGVPDRRARGNLLRRDRRGAGHERRRLRAWRCTGCASASARSSGRRSRTRCPAPEEIEEEVRYLMGVLAG